MVSCGDAVLVVAVQNVAAAGDVAATIGVEAADDVVVGVGVAVVVWV